MSTLLPIIISTYLSVNKKIIIITSGQPSLNPRLVKEADSLTGAGYDVTVLYAYWNHWGTLHDEKLSASRKWKAIRFGGDPEQNRVTWFLSRLIHKISRSLLQKTWNYKYFADLAIARSSYFLIKGAKKHRADLYIAHNLGALPAAAKAARFYKKPYGFDAEDFHRQEVNNDTDSFHFKICSYLEDKYLPPAKYLTASSPLIAGLYTTLYKRIIPVILNVFPQMHKAQELTDRKGGPLRLFWFSQTIGYGRGLEEVVQALCGLKKYGFELHVLGDLPEGVFKKYLSEMISLNGLKIAVYTPIPSDDIAAFAARFDIGLAVETGEVLNRDICLTNKIFTYLQAGLAIIASDTSAQQCFLDQYPAIGRLYRKTDIAALSQALIYFNENRDALNKAGQSALMLTHTTLNWEYESEKFLAIVKGALLNNGKD
jgi:glycosyltransferase involved in cell wall biosynthesis